MPENSRYREEEKEIEEKERVNEKPEEKEAVEEKIINEASTEQVEDNAPPLKKSKVKKLHEQINELEASEKALLEKVKDLQNELLKDRAEVENFKRRTNEERIKDRKYAMQDFFTEFINTVDIFDKAVNVQTDDEKLKKYLIGFTMVNTQMKQILENNGVTKIKALGEKFNPAYHAAIETVKCEDQESGIVIEEIMTGYMYKDRVLRPSMVKVSE